LLFLVKKKLILLLVIPFQSCKKFQLAAILLCHLIGHKIRTVIFILPFLCKKGRHNSKYSARDFIRLPETFEFVQKAEKLLLKTGKVATVIVYRVYQKERFC